MNDSDLAREAMKLIPLPVKTFHFIIIATKTYDLIVQFEMPREKFRCSDDDTSFVRSFIRWK